MFSAKMIATLLAGASVVAAGVIPTNTIDTTLTTNTVATALPVDSAVVTHRVAVGLGGLQFQPNNIVAQPGDIVEFGFLAKNHSVAQSSFDEPCKPLVDPATSTQTGFFSGFNFAVAEPGVLAANVYQIEVTNTKPIWFYCPQAVGGSHCSRGMAGVINQNFDSDKKLAKYIANAANTVSVVPSTIQGGLEGPNPNPDASL